MNNHSVFPGDFHVQGFQWILRWTVDHLSGFIKRGAVAGTGKADAFLVLFNGAAEVGAG
jgi:hypothetical protein